MNPSVKLIIFRLKEEQYGMDLQHVQSIEFLHDVVPAYHSLGDEVKWKGKVIPIIDLAETLLGEKVVRKEENRILIVEEGDKQTGLLVNETIDIVDIDIESIQSPSCRNEGISEEKLKGTASIHGNQVMLLHLEQILKKEEGSTIVPEVHKEENG